MKAMLVLLLLLPVIAAAVDTDKATGLIKNPGWEQVRVQCGSCHSHALVTNQRADRKTWLDISPIEAATPFISSMMGCVFSRSVSSSSASSLLDNAES